MHVMPTCHFDDAGRRRLALLNDPTIVAVAPDPTESKPCSRLLICLQINQQTIAGKLSPGRRPSPEVYVKSIGLVNKASAPPSKALRLVSPSP